MCARRCVRPVAARDAAGAHGPLPRSAAQAQGRVRAAPCCGLLWLDWGLWVGARAASARRCRGRGSPVMAGPPEHVNTSSAIKYMVFFLFESRAQQVPAVCIWQFCDSVVLYCAGLRPLVWGLPSVHVVSFQPGVWGELLPSQSAQPVGSTSSRALRCASMHLLGGAGRSPCVVSQVAWQRAVRCLSSLPCGIVARHAATASRFLL